MQWLGQCLLLQLVVQMRARNHHRESGFCRMMADERACAMLQVVVDIDGDGSFLMNCQEMATAAIEKLDIKMFILNNQHLGMVVQWEDRFYKVQLLLWG